MGQNQSDEEEEEVELTEIQPLYTRFMKVCPSGALHLHEFRRIFGVQSSSEEEALYMETIFKSFDTNRDNVIDFMEFVAAVHLVLRGNLEDRLKWSFKVYDRDENGKLDRQEVIHVIRILCKLKKNRINMTPVEICDRIFELLDENNDGQISLSEFLEGAEKDAWIMDLLKLDTNARVWFRDNLGKKT
ncbi:guanylate cyclase activator 1g [Danio rerio]|uniref:Guanylate cyclase activating protein 7 n=1 Tax=Danio rerio TaxID=7955 RepID=Q5MAC7_DANRE|nr:guanylate cyclase activator 1g [Danio rerio]AAI62853.1 Guanylate cyclase activator 1g [Danio rerio]AAI62905.1 Guanylate cyclase activator 1g [Danio rerio]AAW23332.1 guanylate cyclase activating protein 7 [Danio rerio]|eukprot:NP_001011660.1 guanylate cyclase activator 1g [Danio rerio]